MKIGIEVQRLFRKEKFGIETSALQLVKKLQQQYPECKFVVYAKDDLDKNCLQQTENLKVRTIKGKLFFDFEQIFLPAAARTDRINILHCTGNTAPFISPVPVVQTLHDVIFMDPISGQDSLYQQWGNYYRRFMVPLVTRKSQIVITVSNYEKQRILNRVKVDEKKIRVIYNGIDEERVRVMKDTKEGNPSVQRKYHLPEKFILFLGNTSARKNALRVIEAYTIYASKTPAPLPIVTSGLSKQFVSDYLAKLQQQDKLKLFISTGYIDDQDLPGIYNLSRLFLYPSLSEGFGMPLVEAMACGTPVITSNVSSLPEIAGDAALLVDPSKTSSIADAILTMLTNDELRTEKTMAGLKNAERFSWAKTAGQVYEVYEQICFNPRGIREATSPVFYELQ
jgi:glycosyltransferase involved in cell wall biosynthesis